MDQTITAPSADDKSRRFYRWLIVPAILIGLGAAALVYQRRAPTPFILDASALYTVVPLDMCISTTHAGELREIRTVEVRSQVEGRARIQTLIDEGTSVKKGDVLLTFDASDLKQSIEDTSLRLQRIEAALASARETLQIQQSQNSAELESAEVALLLAKLNLKRYEGDLNPQRLCNAETDAQMAQINLGKALERLSQTRALFAKQFSTATAVKNDEILATAAQNALDKLERVLKVLIAYTNPRDLAVCQNALTQAEQRVERTRLFNAAMMAQRDAEVCAREQSQRLVSRRLENLQRQLEACTVRAPADGMVVYGTTGASNPRLMQVGSMVWQQQLLFRLPDTTAMKAVVRVRESMASQLKKGMRARIAVLGIHADLNATLTRTAVLPDSEQLWYNPDLREYPVELVLDEKLQELKPGMTATAEICIDELNGVPAVPLSAIYSPDQESHIFVRKGERLEPRKVRVGQMTEAFAEVLDIASGANAVNPGEQVLILRQLAEGAKLLARAGIVEPQD